MAMKRVAPLVGAWIEMLDVDSAIAAEMSLPLWERGLKCFFRTARPATRWSLPLWERGLKSPHLNGNNYNIGRSPCGSVD